MRSAVQISVQSRARSAAILIPFVSCLVFPLGAATMVRLSLDDMISKSTSIVRGKVLDSGTAVAGQVIFTHYKVQVTERWKGSVPPVVDLAVPGGVAKGIRQSFSGVPQFQPGEEYLFFLWTSQAGLTQVIGLTQGLFSVAAGGGADPVVTRPSSHELMLDPQTHRPVKDQKLVMSLSALRARVTSGLKGQ